MAKKQATTQVSDPETTVDDQAAEPEVKPDSKALRQASLLEGQDFDDDVVDDDLPPDVPEDGSEPDGDPFVGRVKELGLDIDDPIELADQYAAMQDRFREMEVRQQELAELAGFGREYLESLRKQKEAEKAPEPVEKEPEGWWNAPEYDPSWNDRYREVYLDPASGEQRMRWKEGTPASVRQAADEREAYIQKWATDLVERPQEVLPRIIKHEFDRYFQEAIYERTVQESQAEKEARDIAFVEQLKQEHGNWMFDGSRVDPVSKQPVLTPAGEHILGLCRQVAELGVSDVQQQWQLAVALSDWQYNQMNKNQEPEPDGEPAPKPDRKTQFLKRGGQGLQNRKGSKTPSETPSVRSQDPSLSPGRQLLASLQEEGQAVEW